METVADKPVKRWTYEEYYRLDDDKRYEIIDGSLLMAPAPDTFHQDWLNELNLRLTPFVRKNKLGRVFIAPVDVILNAENVVQPDLVFVAQRNVSIIQRRGIFGSPDLLVEIISPSTVRRDRYQKKDLYARFGVQEYWLADPGNNSVEVLTLDNGSYRLHVLVEGKGLLKSIVLPAFSLELSELAPGL